MAENEYISPLTNRYGTNEMRQIFSDDFKYRTWRRLWCDLAIAEKNWV